MEGETEGEGEGYKGSVSAAVKIKSADHTMYDDFLEIKVATFDSFDEASAAEAGEGRREQPGLGLRSGSC